MNSTSIASVATNLSRTSTAEAVGVIMLKKANDIDSGSALALINAIPQAPTVSLPAHLGQLINTTA